MFLCKKIIWLLLLDCTVAKTGILREHIDYFSNSWAVKISGDNNTVYRIIKSEGFDMVGEIAESPGLYRITHPRHPKRSKYENKKLTSILATHSEVKWVQQFAMIRRQPKSARCPKIKFKGKKITSAYTNLIRDNLFNDQWYLHDCRPTNDLAPYDLNVIRVWHELKIFGLNVKVQVVDDGVETKHKDLKDIIDTNYSWDFVDNDNTPDPKHTPPFNFNHHGTWCAGIIAMKAGNQVCGAGIAPMVRLGAVRVSLTWPTNDEEDYKALIHKCSEIDVKSCSWGPLDDGYTMPSMQQLTRQALQTGITRGRDGKGTVFVFPSGNGKKAGDNCSFDYFAMSMYTITVSAIEDNGKSTSTSENCAAVIVSAYGEKIVSTDIANRCLKTFWGTSAAVPIVSAIISLALEVGLNAGWREVQHMLVWTSEKANLEKNGWVRNAAGFYHSNAFGFGRIDAYEMVKFARIMKPVPPMNSCVLPIEFTEALEFDSMRPVNVTLKTSGCKGLPSEVNYIEHVQLLINISVWRRNALSIDLVSPAKTATQLLTPRKKDSSEKGFRNWLLDSVRTWGESPVGWWFIFISDQSNKKKKKNYLNSLTLIIHGTKDMPDHYSKPRTYYKESE